MDKKIILISLVFLGFFLGCILSKLTHSYKHKTNKLRWPKCIELIDSLIGSILLFFLIFKLPFYKHLLVIFISMNIGFHLTNVF